eukprot:625765-Pyramimonas_sp.AAC.1
MATMPSPRQLGGLDPRTPGQARAHLRLLAQVGGIALPTRPLIAPRWAVGEDDAADLGTRALGSGPDEEDGVSTRYLVNTARAAFQRW